MAFDVQQFIATINGAGLARSQNFMVVITPPASVTMPNNGNVQDLSFRACQTTLPGRSVAYQEYFTYGPPQKIAFGSTYGSQVDMSIYVSPDFREKLFFERWQDLALGYARGTASNGAGLFDLGYYGDYANGTVVIQQFDQVGTLTHSCTLIEAYPVTVSSSTKAWDSDSIEKLEISWAYRYYHDENYPDPTNTQTTPA